jgi:hypothetical protein
MNRIQHEGVIVHSYCSWGRPNGFWPDLCSFARTAEQQHDACDVENRVKGSRWSCRNLSSRHLLSASPLRFLSLGILICAAPYNASNRSTHHDIGMIARPNYTISACMG